MLSEYYYKLEAFYVYIKLIETGTVVDLLCYMELVSGILSHTSETTYEFNDSECVLLNGQSWVPLEKRNGKDWEY